MDSIIQAKDVSFSYTSHNIDDGSITKNIAIDDLSLHIEKGSFVAIVGHNGSGKSTLAKHFNALLLPDHGEVLVAGMTTEDDENLWNIRKSCSMVFQNPDNQIVATIVEDDVAFGPENLGLERDHIRHRVDDALAGVDMTAFKDQAPHMLSGGQKQRVAIAGVVAMRPDIIVFDESTSMLDPKGRNEINKAALELNKEGITIVWITHFMQEAIHADQIIVMNKGQIYMKGTPVEVFSCAEQLESIGLSVPPMVKLAAGLGAADVVVSDTALDIDTMAEEICQLFARI